LAPHSLSAHRIERARNLNFDNYAFDDPNDEVLHQLRQSQTWLTANTYVLDIPFICDSVLTP
jgi:hypothetical protein